MQYAERNSLSWFTTKAIAKHISQEEIAMEELKQLPENLRSRIQVWLH